MQFERLRTIDAAEVAGKRVLVRVDLNVPMADGRVTDTTRLDRIAPCLNDLAQRGARVVVISHLERPKGPDPRYSLRPVAEKLSEVLGRPVRFISDCVGPVAEAGVAEVMPGDVAVLENLRFHHGEEANDPLFAEQLAALGDLYVGEAFSSSHRAHASTDGITRFLPSYAGPLMAQEIGALRRALEEPQRPTVAIVGGSKVSTKIPILKNLIARVDKLIIGGGMANTFLAAQGIGVGKSLCEDEHLDTAREIIGAAKERGCEVVLPPDVIVAPALEEGASTQAVPVLSVPPDQMILDLGPKAVAHVIDVLSRCKTLLWNGPLGAFEVAPFGEGTFAVAREAARLTRAGKIVSVAGGGDTVAALNAAGSTGSFTYVSTAGGAFLEWLEGRELPGVAALLRF